MEETFSDNRPARPVFLKVLCILTFICTGLNLLFILLGLLSGKPTVEQMERQETQMLQNISMIREQGNEALARLMEQIEVMNSYINEMFYSMTLINFVTVLLGLFGALFMWRGKKAGFHMYIIYSLLSVATVYIAVPVKLVPPAIPILNLILSGIFVLMYSRNLKWLR